MHPLIKVSTAGAVVAVLAVGALAAGDSAPADRGASDPLAAEGALPPTTESAADRPSDRESFPAPPGAGETGARAADVVVYKTPTCGCCSRWVDHLRASGYTVVAHDTSDVSPIKREWGIPSTLFSCHTARLDGYVIEGHVPASDLERLLRERPEVVGIAVPGMPMGSPGMEGARSERYDVVAFDSAGRTTVFSRH